MAPDCMRHVKRERSSPARVVLDALELEPAPDGSRWIRREPGVPWYVLTFPFADELRDALRDRKLLNAVRAAALRLLEAVVLADNGIDADELALGVLEVTHPEGDRSPSVWAAPDLVRKAESAVTGEWKPHLNFLFPLLAAELRTTIGIVHLARRRRLRWTLTKRALALLRLGFGLLQEAVKRAPLGRSAVVYGEFRSQPEHKAHAIKYFARGFPAWSADAQRVRWYGLFATRVVARVPEVIAARALEQERLADELRKRTCCQVCGARLRVADERRAELLEKLRLDHWRLLSGADPPGGDDG
jgi:hypothetical protein